MKRLLPFDSEGCSYGSALRRSDDHHRDAVVVESATDRQTVVPDKVDPRRTAFYAVVTGGEDDMLSVQEAPIEIMPFRDTDLVQFSYQSDVEQAIDLQVAITESTYFDLDRPGRLPANGTPLIVIGLDVGGTIEAEVIAGMDSEARYRQIVLKHQGSREWHRPMSTNLQAGS